MGEDNKQQAVEKYDKEIFHEMLQQQKILIEMLEHKVDQQASEMKDFKENET